MPRTRAFRFVLAVLLVLGVLTPLAATTPAAAITLPSGFQEQIVFTGLNRPTNMEFAPDGRVFVAEQGGRIKVFDDLADTTATVFADLSTNVHSVWDRGLLGLALPPNFPADPWVYVLYTYDAPPGQTAPVWNDTGCVGGANSGSCVVTSRLSKLRAAGDVMTGEEQVLIHDWCQQFASHSTGDLAFGQDGMLYVSAGDGASFNSADYGQQGSPVNPCGDPAQEGGAVRSQDVRSIGDPTGLNGTLLRLDPATGLAAPGNAAIGSADLNTRRVVAHGLRNPYRFTVRPGTNEIWSGDVGWGKWEEINRLADPTTGVTNFGWPCYEGSGRMGAYDSVNLPLCESLYPIGQTAPYYAWDHGAQVVPGEPCGSGSSSATGLAFYPTTGGTYPTSYRGALFFSDYSRRCIWTMKPSAPGGLPDPANIETFGAAASTPVDLEIGPGGELYYVDVNGSVRRIRYFAGNQPPTAVIGATPTSGGVPLAVTFNATGSSDPDPADAGRLTYQWDYTNDGVVDATTATASFTYLTAGSHTAKLTVTDTLGAVDTRTVVISAGNNAPTAFIDTPVDGATWRVDDTVTFTGHATDPQQGTLPATALQWHLRMQHCYSAENCHTHFLQDWDAVSGGSFVAPDHEYPSYLELELTATDAQGLTSTVVRRLDPKTVKLTFTSSPVGRTLSVGAVTKTTPFTVTVMQGSTNSVSAPTPQTDGATTYTFDSWSDGGDQTHVITAPNSATAYTATYAVSEPACADSFGYTCETKNRAFVAAGTVLDLSGDEGRQTITLPFAFPFYGRVYSEVTVDVNGLLSFGVLSGDTAANRGIPDRASPNAAVYAYWDDLVVDAAASVRTGTFGTAPARYTVVEWRNVQLAGNPAQRLSVEAILYEDGTVVLNYTGLDNAGERGQSATVGIENGFGTVALPFSHNEAALVSGTSVIFTPPAVVRGTITGKVTMADTGAPVAGATVMLEPGNASAITAGDGTYQLTNVVAGTYTVVAQSPAGSCGPMARERVTVTSATSTVNLALAVITDPADTNWRRLPCCPPGTDPSLADTSLGDAVSGDTLLGDAVSGDTVADGPVAWSCLPRIRITS